jgi:hypothetical protein
LISVQATPKFLQLAKKNLSSDALQELIDYLVMHPEQGVLIQGTAGIRKLRWKTGKDNKGKSGGVRILYFYNKSKLIIILVTLFKKSEQENIDASEKIILAKLVKALTEK